MTLLTVTSDTVGETYTYIGSGDRVRDFLTKATAVIPGEQLRGLLFGLGVVTTDHVSRLLDIVTNRRNKA